MENPKQMLAAIYARVSGDRQKKEETIESQIDAIQQYAKAKNYIIVNEWIFKDEAETGKFLEKPGLDALRDLAREGNPDVIIVHEPDRLIRKNCYQTLLLEEFQKLGVKLEFVKVKSPETPEEQFALDMMGVFAEYEREKIADRCRRGRLYKAKTGKLSVLPNAPYGFNYIREGNQSTYEINPTNAEIVKTIFFLYTQKNYTLTKIANYLDEKIISTPKLGKHWDRATIRDILKNEAYTGTTYFGRTEKCNGVPNRIVRHKGKKNLKSRHARKEKPKDAWIPISVPGFISENDFQLAQEQLKLNKKHSTRNTKELSLLQGLIICKECRCSFYKKKRSNQKTVYACHSMLAKHMSKCGNKPIKQEELDSLVWGEVVKLLKDPLLLEQEISRRASESLQKGNDQLKHGKLEKELKHLFTAKDKLLDAYQEGNCLTIDELRPRMEKIKKRIKEIENELANLNVQRVQGEKNIDYKATLEHLEKRISKSSEELSTVEKQKIVRLLVEEIVIGKDCIKIKHCIPSSLKDKNSPLNGVCSMAAFAAPKRSFLKVI